MAGQIDPESLTWRVTPDLLGVLDTSGYFRFTNPAWERTLGFEAQEIESREFLEFIHPEDIPRTKSAFVDIQSGTPVLNFENRYRHKQGHYRWLSWNAVPEEGYFFCSARDITHHKDNAATLATKEDEARLREQFIAVLGHDLRNPVTAVDAAMRMLLREEQTEQSKLLIDMTRQTTRRMKDLLDNLTDFAKVRLGEGVSVEPMPGCDLREVVEQTIAELQVVFPEAKVKTDFNLRDAYTLDPMRIGQVMSNLVANALTHGKPGGDVDVVGADTGAQVEITVRNTGQPIPKDILPLIFEPYARRGRDSTFEGLGLGLFISKQIALAHGGDLTVQTDDEATAFRLVLPVQ